MKKGFYRHYKGNYYQVIDLALHADTCETFVVYRGLYGNFNLWIRQLNSFNEHIIINEQKIPRFEFIGEEYDILPKQVLDNYLCTINAD